MNKNQRHTAAEAEKGYWEACADYDMTRSETPLDWRLQAFAADQVALWRERWIKAVERECDKRVPANIRPLVGQTVVQLETGEPREFYDIRKKR